MKRIIICWILLLSAAAWLLPMRSEATGGVAVGGIQILKTNVSGDPLEGAVFQIAREVKDSELTDGKLDKQILKVGEENKIVTYENFWNNRELAGERTNSVTTDSEGKAAIYGLPYGTYYLVETAAPEGYNRITSPIRLTIHKYSHLTEEDNVRDDKGVVIDNTLHIINIRYTLPDTGNRNTVQMTAAGVGILFSAAALLLLNRKRRGW